MINNEEEFLAAYRNIQWPTPTEPEYRIYYDPKDGKILHITNDKLEGDFIVVDKETFHQSPIHHRVKNGKLVPPEPTYGKLVPGEQGTSTDPTNVTLIDESGTKWAMKNQ